MNMLVFSFQNMEDIHKGYAYQFFKFFYLKKNLQEYNLVSQNKSQNSK